MTYYLIISALVASYLIYTQKRDLSAEIIFNAIGYGLGWIGFGLEMAIMAVKAWRSER